MSTKKLTKRIIAVILTLALCVSGISVAALAGNENAYETPEVCLEPVEMGIENGELREENEGPDPDFNSELDLELDPNSQFSSLNFQFN